MRPVRNSTSIVFVSAWYPMLAITSDATGFLSMSGNCRTRKYLVGRFANDEIVAGRGGLQQVVELCQCRHRLTTLITRVRVPRRGAKSYSNIAKGCPEIGRASCRERG